MKFILRYRVAFQNFFSSLTYLSFFLATKKIAINMFKKSLDIATYYAVFVTQRSFGINFTKKCKKYKKAKNLIFR
jgi:hypothetical protein